MLNNIMPKNIAFTGLSQVYKANKNINSTNLQQFMVSSLPMIPIDDYTYKGKLNLIA